MRNALAKEVGAFAGVAGGRGGSCLFLRREDKFPSPPNRVPRLPFTFLFLTHNDADCSTAVIITLCLKIQNKSQERNWLGL